LAGGRRAGANRYVGMPAFRFGNIHEGGLDRARVKKYHEDIHGAPEARPAPRSAPGERVVR